MPWWSWVLIWVGLVLALLAVLALGAWYLFRKAMTAFGALEELGSTLDLLDANLDELTPEPFVPSVLRDPAEVREAHRASAELRADRKRERRERRLARGKLLVTADLRQRTFPWDSSATHSPDGT